MRVTGTAGAGDYGSIGGTIWQEWFLDGDSAIEVPGGLTANGRTLYLRYVRIGGSDVFGSPVTNELKTDNARTGSAGKREDLSDRWELSRRALILSAPTLNDLAVVGPRAGATAGGGSDEPYSWHDSSAARRRAQYAWIRAFRALTAEQRAECAVSLDDGVGRAELTGGLVGSIQAKGPIVGRAELTGGLVGSIQAKGPIVGRAELTGGLVGSIQAKGPIVGRAELTGDLAGAIAAFGDIGRPPSALYARALRSLAPPHTIVSAIEISHPDLATPVRAVNASADQVIEGHVYFATRFLAALVDDVEGQPPRAQISIDNVGRAMTQVIDDTSGGRGASIRVMQVILAPEALIQWDVTLDVLGMHQAASRVQVDLGFDPGLAGPSVLLRHDPHASPGLF